MRLSSLSSTSSTVLPLVDMILLTRQSQGRRDGVGSGECGGDRSSGTATARNLSDCSQVSYQPTEPHGVSARCLTPEEIPALDAVSPVPRLRPRLPRVVATPDDASSSASFRSHRRASRARLQL